jgi:1-acyl-sn-glycerol-3-phosphate acyltransferase
MVLLFRLLRKAAGWIDFILFTALVYLLSWLPWRGKHPVARLFNAWCRSFVRALDVDLRLHQKNLKRLPRRFILIANHPAAFEDIGIPALFDVVSLAKRQVQDWFIVGRISKAAGTLYVDRDDPASRHHAIDAMVEAIQAGKNIALYPEGGCKGRRADPAGVPALRGAGRLRVAGPGHPAGQDRAHDDHGEQPRQLLRLRPDGPEGLRRQVRDEGRRVREVREVERPVPGVET